MAGFDPPLGTECKRIKTTAEKIFDLSAYSGIGWVGNAALSTSIAYYLEYSKSGAKKFTNFAKKIAQLINKENPNIQHTTNKLEFLSLIIGGTILMWPLKKMEDHKGNIVRGIDKIIGGVKSICGWKESKEETEQKEEAFKLLEAEPKQNWKNILRARFVGLGAALLTLHTVDKISPVDNKMLKEVTATVAGSAHKKWRPGAPIEKNERIKKITELATIDVIYSFVAAAGLYIDSHFINPPKNKNRNLQDNTLSPLNPPNEETSWIGHAKPRAKSPPAAPVSSFAEAELAKQQSAGEPAQQR